MSAKLSAPSRHLLTALVRVSFLGALLLALPPWAAWRARTTGLVVPVT